MYKGVPKWCMFNCQNYDLVYYDVILQRHRRINTPPPQKKKKKKKHCKISVCTGRCGKQHIIMWTILKV